MTEHSAPSTQSTDRNPTVFVTLQARDAAGLIGFLTDVLGFVLTARYDDGDRVAHAELVRPDGRGGVMLGSHTGDSTWSREPGSAGSYVVVSDIDALYQQVLEQQADVVMPLEGTPYGSREFAVRDPEGNLWSVGTYPGEPLPTAAS
ncbi:VOC family protein [Brachybacterium sacelli]|uniref:Glyoxalase superfamily protein PhnB n=1 Tax=Brachybacterium sacelli TaxID=173364 RepID=A0ABS4X1A1_9MICO|nr:VOC family protein [Brachybacterium sacelli]MBP2382225.1 putative glyoxalase superfamily protein PhnB [Brachybacterium sacelli]